MAARRSVSPGTAPNTVHWEAHCRRVPWCSSTIFHTSLGIDRTTYLDWVGFQELIDYRTLRTPRDVYERLSAIGVTHVVYAPGARTAPSKQEEVVFDAFAGTYATPKGKFGNLELLEMPKVPPPCRDPFVY